MELLFYQRKAEREVIDLEEGREQAKSDSKMVL